ncbi:MAG TPA: hypothetical protein VGG08_12050 [Solirubrobacteraceae bacterium]
MLYAPLAKAPQLENAPGGVWKAAPILILSGGTIPVIPYTSQSKAWGAAPTETRSDALDIIATNVSHVTIDAKRAHVDCNAKLAVNTDGPLEVTLAECHGKRTSRTLSFGG